jgi:hypothetical protein
VKFDTVFYDYGVENTVDLSPAVDTYIVNITSSGYPTGSYLYAGYYYYSGYQIYRSLLSFSIPNATIDGGVLYLYATSSYTGSTDGAFELWSCGSFTSDVGWPTQPSMLELMDTVPATGIGKWYAFSLSGSYLQSRAGSKAYFLLKRAVETPSAEAGRFGFISSDSASSDKPYLRLKYIDFSASWSWYPLPLSVVAMPVGRQLVLGLLGGLICFTTIVKLSSRRQRKRGVRKR